MKEYDIAVIGGGPGGYVAAIRAAQAGACVCLVERDKVGGTCLNRGCIPTKALYSTAHLLQAVRSAAAHGIEVGETKFDFGRAAGRKDEVVARLVGGVEQLLKGNGVEVFRGEASLEGPGRVRIRRPDLTAHIRAKKIILATGSLPLCPHSLPVDGKNVLTSNEILAIKELPESLLIVGGGYIGCEFAGIFATFGTKVTLVEQLPADKFEGEMLYPWHERGVPSRMIGSAVGHPNIVERSYCRLSRTSFTDARPKICDASRNGGNMRCIRARSTPRARWSTNTTAGSRSSSRPATSATTCWSSRTTPTRISAWSSAARSC